MSFIYYSEPAQQYIKKLEALGQGIPPPRHVLPVPLSDESV